MNQATAIPASNGWTTQRCNQPKPQPWQRQPNSQTTHQHDMATEIVVSLVGGGFAVVVALISKIGLENKKDHGIVHKALGRIEEKIDNHVENHR
jgi:hypothetical protein